MKIHVLASDGDLAGVRGELAKGVPVDARDEHDFTPLACAARSKEADVEMVQLLIDSGAEFNAPVDEGRCSPVGLAACSGDLGKVQLLLDAGADINFVSPNEYTPLVDVTYRLYDSEQLVPVIEFLVQNGAETDCETTYGESPLGVAYRLGRFDAVKCLLRLGADPSPLGWTKLMRAIALGSYEEVKSLLDVPSGLDSRDKFGRTPWLLSSLVGDLDKAKLLHTAGVSVGERSRHGETALMFASGIDHADMVRWLIQIDADVEGVDDSESTALMSAAQAGATRCVEILLEAGADPSRKNEFDDTVMELASNERVVRALMKAGEDIGDTSTEMKRQLTGLQGGEYLNVTKAEYLAGKTPRFGKSNPEVMDVPFWREMVRSGISAYQARKQFGDTDSLNSPVWCFSRFGTSFTELPDGRFVQVGGEHEDFYDPDFCIYNDVIVHDSPGQFRILGYPEAVFPPTDFHSTTYVDGVLYLVGGLGYYRKRDFGRTPIYRLDCQTWELSSVESSGESPGWIFEHKARLLAPKLLGISGGEIYEEVNGEEQYIENGDEFVLDLRTMVWTRRRAQ